MEREILFRGKRVDNGEWLYGHYSHSGAKYFIQVNYSKHEDDFDIYEVLPETIGQFTGLTDKRGVKIFEGDIISYTQHYFNTDMQNEKRKEVKYSVDRWNIFETNAGESNIEIIGKIHDNTELLK